MDRTATIRDEYPAPVFFRNLGVYEKAEEDRTTTFDHLKGTRIRNSQKDVLPKFRTLAAFIADSVGETLPSDCWTSDDLFLGSDENGFWGEVSTSELAIPEPVAHGGGSK